MFITEFIFPLSNKYFKLITLLHNILKFDINNYK